MNTEHTNQSRQAEPVNQQLLDALAQLVRVVKLQRPWGASVHKAEKAIAAAEQERPAEPVTLCATCARADVNCPVYPQQTDSCAEHRPAAQQQAELVTKTDTSLITAADAALRHIAAMHGAEVPLEPFSAAVTAQALASALHPHKTPVGREADSKMVMAISTTQQQAEPVAFVQIGSHAPILPGSDGLHFEGTPSGALKVTCTREHAPAVAVPEGYALAPVDPTSKMLMAADRVIWADADILGNYCNLWNAMLAAAQKGGA